MIITTGMIIGALIFLVAGGYAVFKWLAEWWLVLIIAVPLAIVLVGVLFVRWFLLLEKHPIPAILILAAVWICFIALLF